MSSEQQQKLKAYDVQCGDGTSGRVSAGSPQAAEEMAGEMCQVHEGAKGQPRERAQQ